MKEFPFNARIISLTMLLIFILSACQTNTNDPSSQEPAAYTGKPVAKKEFLLDTVCTITLYSTDDETIIDEALAEIKRYEKLFSVTIDTSEVSKINAAAGKPVTVSDDTIDILNKSIEYSRLSDGRFDVTCGVLTTAWHFSNNEGEVPPLDVIEKGVNTVNYENIKVEGNTVTLLNPETRLDFGAIAKGYIADRISEFLKSKGVSGAIINLGGNVLTVGQKPSGEPWNVGIQRPFKDRDISMGVVQVGEKSVGTSGIYERYFEKDGKLYHHLLDLKTGYPAENDIASVTIISDLSVDGEGLSTSCFLMSMDEAIAWIESIPGTEAIFITKDNKMHMTSGIGTTIPFTPES